MKRLIVASLAVLALGVGIAVSQVPNFPQTLPANTVVGRLGTGPGPSQAIPFGTLFANLFNGGSAPTAHSVLLGEGSNALGMATTGTAGRLLIDKGAGTDPAFTVPSGDVTNDSLGVFTIGANKVTNAKAAQMAAGTFKCNNTGSTANSIDCTAAQVKIALNTISVVKTQTFTSSGTYTPSTGLVYAIFDCVGGGGGGGGAASGSGNLGAAGGGGSGGHSVSLASAATIGASQTVTINTGGAGGAAGNNNGTVGGSVSVGSICVANGGGAGPGAPGGSAVPGGSPAAAGTGNVLALPGSSGQRGIGGAIITMPSMGGDGGLSAYGGAGTGGFTTVVSNLGVVGGAAAGYGSGGGGAAVANANTNPAGGAGKNGIVVVYEYTNQ